MHWVLDQNGMSFKNIYTSEGVNVTSPEVAQPVKVEIPVERAILNIVIEDGNVKVIPGK